MQMEHIHCSGQGETIDVFPIPQACMASSSTMEARWQGEMFLDSLSRFLQRKCAVFSTTDSYQLVMVANHKQCVVLGGSPAPQPITYREVTHSCSTEEVSLFEVLHIFLTFLINLQTSGVL